jgi:hypothetical protein
MMSGRRQAPPGMEGNRAMAADEAGRGEAAALEADPETLGGADLSAVPDLVDAPSAPPAAGPAEAEEDPVRRGALGVLEGTWRPEDGFCPPNPTTYPHLWLWDSCFHAIAWAGLGDPRAATELGSCLQAQLSHGFVPHMRYASPSINRGPLADRSSFTQPPIYAHAARAIAGRGIELTRATLPAVTRALDYLWEHRRTDDGLLFIVHPWESGSDDSPRWDSWIGRSDWNRLAFTAADHRLVAAALFDNRGAAVTSRAFVAAPSAFNAFAGHAAAELAALTGDATWARRAAELAEAVDGLLWDEAQGLWVDRAIVGDGATASIPTLDGLMPALITADEDKARRALAQAADPTRFAAPFGPRFLPRDHPAYRADEYWRGPAWPQLGYMRTVAARAWGEDALAAELADTGRRSALASGFAEYWNPETGDGLGARPQGWAAVAAAYPAG